MIRNLKAMGLALFAVFALVALGAQSASAVVNHQFTSDSATGNTVLTGKTEAGTKEVFKLTNAKVECEDVSYRGTVVGGTVDHVSVVPIFTNAKCTVPVLGVATIHNSGCTYTFGSDTSENNTHYTAGSTHANVSLACGDTGSITITAGGCTIHVGTTHQTPAPNTVVNHNLPGIHYDTLANHSDGKSAITVTATVKTIKALTTGANCSLVGLGSNGTHSNGEYEGKAIVTGYTDPAGSPTLDPHTNSLSEGTEVNLGLSTP